MEMIAVFDTASIATPQFLQPVGPGGLIALLALLKVVFSVEPVIR
jgi:hypothetical protein